MTPLPPILGDEAGLQPSSAPVTVGIIQPAIAYEEAGFTDVIIPAGAWVLLINRDIQRALFMVMKTPGSGDMLIRPGGSPMAVPFMFPDASNAFTLSYVDFLTVVTGDLYGFHAGGITVTVGNVRKH